MQQQYAEDITFDETIFLILKAVGRPLSVPEIIEYLYDWQLAEIERIPSFDRFIPRPIIKMMTYLRSGQIYAALEFLGEEGNVSKKTRFEVKGSPWSNSKSLMQQQEYAAISWPQR